MKLEIKLKDPTKCEGCPCKIEMKEGEREIICRYYNGIEILRNRRLDMCLTENGL